MATSTPGGSSGTNLGMAPNTAGLLCYAPCCIGLVFSIVAAIVEKQSRFVRFHAFQSLLLNGAGDRGAHRPVDRRTPCSAGSSVWLVGPCCGSLQMLVGLGVLAVSVFMMLKANAGEEIELPVIGPMAQAVGVVPSHFAR